VPLASLAGRIATSTAPARPVAVARVVVGVAALGKAVDLAPALLAVVGSDALRMPYGAWSPELPAVMGPAILWIWTLSAAAFLVGWRTRWAGTALVLAMSAALVLDQQLYSNHFYLLVVVAFLLTCADSGAAISLDARRKGPRDAIPGWPVTLLKLQLSIVYGYAVLAKLNLFYVSGSVFSVYWVREGWLALPDPLRRVEVLFPLAVVSLLVEATLAVGMWLPRLRHQTFLLGLAFHLAIIPTMGVPGQLVLFAALMFALYLQFLDARPRSRVVIWDEDCSFCRAWVRWLHRLDWLRVHQWVPSSNDAALAHAGITRDEADRAIQLVRPDGTTASGFAAFRSILQTLPVSFLWAPALGFPPVERIGDRIYARVAARRRCLAVRAGD
jgi:predicted DCC family thiol-disulfide oxidoreductase YuxK